MPSFDSQCFACIAQLLFCNVTTATGEHQTSSDGLSIAALISDYFSVIVVLQNGGYGAVGSHNKTKSAGNPKIQGFLGNFEVFDHERVFGGGNTVGGVPQLQLPLKSLARYAENNGCHADCGYFGGSSILFFAFL